jgi:hypothetical protein
MCTQSIKAGNNMHIYVTSEEQMSVGEEEEIKMIE